MKNIKFFAIMILLFTLAFSAQAQHRSFSQVNQELVTGGYVEVSNPSGYPQSWSGATLHFYHKVGITTGVVVYSWPSENDLPPEAACNKKASSSIIPGSNPPKTQELCDGDGNECKGVGKTDVTGKVYDVEVVCCG